MSGRPDVAVFTDTYRPTVNGVTYAIATWRDEWRDRGGRMAVVYPDADYDPRADEHPVTSLPFPFYDGYRLGLPRLPAAVTDPVPDVVHTHTPFGVALAGRRLANRHDLPLVASYHTPTGEYADYLAPTSAAAAALRRVSERYERWFFDTVDVVLTPSDSTRAHLVSMGIDTPVEVVPNGIDLDFFAPTDAADFRREHDLPDDRTLVGYTGRHGYEKRLADVLDAAADLDVTVVFGGDGPARSDLETQADALGVDARFLDFLDRSELPAFYAALDAFVFPSPVETQGLVALESIACGTPVVGANDGALATTITDGVTGYHFPTGDVAAFRDALERALANSEKLREQCLDRRADFGVDDAVDTLEAVYRNRC